MSPARRISFATLTPDSSADLIVISSNEPTATVTSLFPKSVGIEIACRGSFDGWIVSGHRIGDQRRDHIGGSRGPSQDSDRIDDPK